MLERKINVSLSMLRVHRVCWSKRDEWTKIYIRNCEQRGVKNKKGSIFINVGTSFW